ncbi:hypothetical protein GCM10012280_15760 [Wenjunlia tyrosinilytica]|uniref:DUF3048 domain-containing protein n=1 Tax=Wenjunlia tyrosinilytica TaxID=1544741 RepID=A0A918DW78_9ACTN|nr:hypothetical protein GCM10012280_15760 [Wenjunlia tyrosinilytica]
MASAALLSLGLGACDGSGNQDSSGRASSVSTFTGLPGRPAPVLAVKIDNVPSARPQTGLGKADIVYVEQVEAGQTRILAVFSSHTPAKAGPVRSARESDLELLRQFGEPDLAYSGVQSKLQPLLEAAPLHARPPEKVPSAYSRDNSRPAPHNLYVDTGRVLAVPPSASDAPDIGFRFGDMPKGGHPVAERTVRFPVGRYGFTWSQDEHRWLVSMDGQAARTTDGGRLGAATVVVQYVKVRPSRFHDRWGAVSPYTESVGSGTAFVLRDGKGYDVRWKRGSAQEGTEFTTASGDRMAFARGPVWVLFAAR